jgi:hypothetical protein
MPPSAKKVIPAEQWEAKLAGVKVSKEDMNRLVMNFLVTEVRIGGWVWRAAAVSSLQLRQQRPGIARCMCLLAVPSDGGCCWRLHDVLLLLLCPSCLPTHDTTPQPHTGLRGRGAHV